MENKTPFQQVEQIQQTRQNKTNKPFLIILVILTFFSSAAAVFFGYQNYKLKKRLWENPATPTIPSPTPLIVDENIETNKTTKFRGTITETNNECWLDGTCSIRVNDKWIEAQRGGLQAPGVPREPRGQLIGINFNTDTKQYINKEVEVYVGVKENGRFSIYGSEEYYIKLLLAPQGTEKETNSSDKLAEFHLTGGFIGFCDYIVIYMDGEASYLNECSDKQLNFQVKSEDFNQLISFVNQFGEFSYENEDNPDGPDSLSTQLTLYGQGSSLNQPGAKQRDNLIVLMNSILIENRLAN